MIIENLVDHVELYLVEPVAAAEVVIRVSDRPLIDSGNIWNVRLENNLSYDVGAFRDIGYVGGETSTDYGELKISNADGWLDAYIFHSWVGRRIVYSVGALGDPVSNHDVLLDGVIDAVKFDEESVTVSLRDNTVNLEDDILQERFVGDADGDPSSYGGHSDIEGQYVPIPLGNVSRVPAQVVNRSTLIYRWGTDVGAVTAVYDGENLLGDGGAVSLAEITNPDFVVENGYYVYHNALGLIRLGAPPDQNPTVSGNGNTYGEAYDGTIINVVRQILTSTGSGPIAINETNFFDLSFETRLNFEARLWIPGSRNTTRADVLKALLFPLGVFWGFNSAGEFQIKMFELPVGGGRIINANSILEDGDLKIVRVEEARSEQVVEYPGSERPEEPNPGDGVGDGVNEAEKPVLVKRVVSFSVDTDVWPNRETPVIEALVSNADNAAVIAGYWLYWYSAPRRLMEIGVSWDLNDLQLGDSVEVVYPRFGLDDGVDLVVVGKNVDADESSVKLTLWG